MHTMTKTVNGTEFHVSHNGDWSGDAIIMWQLEGEGKTRSVVLPGALLRACGRSAAIADAISALEGLSL